MEKFFELYSELCTQFQYLPLPSVREEYLELSSFAGPDVAVELEDYSEYVLRSQGRECLSSQSGPVYNILQQIENGLQELRLLVEAGSSTSGVASTLKCLAVTKTTDVLTSTKLKTHTVELGSGTIDADSPTTLKKESRSVPHASSDSVARTSSFVQLLTADLLVSTCVVPSHVISVPGFHRSQFKYDCELDRYCCFVLSPRQLLLALTELKCCLFHHLRQLQALKSPTSSHTVLSFQQASLLRHIEPSSYCSLHLRQRLLVLSLLNFTPYIRQKIFQDKLFSTISTSTTPFALGKWMLACSGTDEQCKTSSPLSSGFRCTHIV